MARRHVPHQPASGVPRAASPVRQEWLALAASGSPRTFSTDQLVGQPDALRRWIGGALVPGSPIEAAYRFTMSGEIKLNRHWRSFHATQLSNRLGYIWAAELRAAGLPVRGFDRFTSGTGRLDWRILGRIPVTVAAGADVSISAAGRLAAEIVLTPTAYEAAAWRASDDPAAIDGEFRLSTSTEVVSVRLGDSGDPTAVVMQRWGDPETSGSFGRHPFGAELSGHRWFDGVRIPTELRVGWWPQSPRWAAGEFFRARIRDVSRG